MEPNPSVLIIDDDPSIRESLEAYLEDRNFQVQTAENGKEGLKLIHSNIPDIVLLDLSMPQASGFEVLASEGKDHPDLPFIVISGTGRIQDTVRALHLGAADYLMKPISDLSMVVYSIEKVLERKRLKQENQRYREHLEALVEKRTVALKQLSRAIEHVNEVVVITDKRGIIQYANAAFERVTGYTLAEVIGQNPRILKSGKHDAFFYRNMWDRISSGSTWSGRITNRRKDGSLYHDQAAVYPIRNSEGEIVQFVSVKRDITQEIQLEEQLRHAQKMQAIGTLAGGIAHDFNNILSVIIGFAQLIQEDAPEDNEDIRSEIGGILKACTRAKNLVKQILTFSRQTEGEKRPIRLQPLIQEAVNLLRASIPATIELNCRLDSPCGLVLADATQVHQVLMNLSTNAYHALRDTGGVIEISLEERDLSPAMISAHPRLMPGKHAVITVKDDGIGMSATTLQRIFEPYFTTKASGEGTGLGLAIVDSIIEQHGGTIDVSSELGKGTRFELFFPICLRSDSEGFDEIEPAKPLGTERVLFVDDETDIAEINRNGLEKFGYRVMAFSNPLEAIEHFQSHADDFDVVVTDLTMPKMTGTELADRIYAIRPDIPLVLCSGFAKSAREVQGKLSGVWEFVQKPIQPGSVGLAIRRVMEKRQERPSKLP